MERFKATPSVYTFFIQDNKILLGRRCNIGWSDGLYGVPAGHMEGGECASDAARRECSEEVGILLDRNDLEIAHIAHRRSADERIDFFFGKKMGGRAAHLRTAFMRRLTVVSTRCNT